MSKFKEVKKRKLQELNNQRATILARLLNLKKRDDDKAKEIRKNLLQDLEKVKARIRETKSQKERPSRKPRCRSTQR